MAIYLMKYIIQIKYKIKYVMTVDKNYYKNLGNE